VAGNEPAPPVIVCDAGPLIHLDEVGCVELLTDFPQVLVPNAVWDEVAKHRPSAFMHGTVRFQKVTPDKALSAELDVLSRLLALHRGEREALQVAQAQPGCLLLTDARRPVLRPAISGLRRTGQLACCCALSAANKRRRTKL
jgi:predicted nucleic acid-binding protein